MISYIFTPTGFYPDAQEKDTPQERYEKLYHMGFAQRPADMSASELFLYEVSLTLEDVGQLLAQDFRADGTFLTITTYGLLGTSKEFHEFAKNLEEHPEGYAKLKSMITPFMLRRVKTDKSVITDLPEKVELRRRNGRKWSRIFREKLMCPLLCFR